MTTYLEGEGVKLVFEPTGWYSLELACKDKHGNPHVERSDIPVLSGEYARCGECGGVWRPVMRVLIVNALNVEKSEGENVKKNGEFNPGRDRVKKQKKRKKATAFIVQHDGKKTSDFERTNVMSRPDLIKVT